MTTLADDSGLEVEALGGQPGVYSARFAGEPGDDEANNRKLLRLMKDVPAEQRRARFVCVVAVSDPNGETRTVCGVCEGRIAFGPRGYRRGLVTIPCSFPQATPRALQN